MIKLYKDKQSDMIHMVADFPAPRREGHTNCGRPLILLERYRGKRSKLHYYQYCLKCKQLTGE